MHGATIESMVWEPFLTIHKKCQFHNSIITVVCFIFLDSRYRSFYKLCWGLVINIKMSHACKKLEFCNLCVIHSRGMSGIPATSPFLKCCWSLVHDEIVTLCHTRKRIFWFQPPVQMWCLKKAGDCVCWFMLMHLALEMKDKI